MTKKQYVILDRDGTIIKDVAHITKISDIEFLPHAIEGLTMMQEMGFELIIITNQAVIARKMCTYDDVVAFNEELLKHLESHGVKISATYFCPHHPEFTGECICRKPKIGMVKVAAKDFGFLPSQTIFIGDKDSDTQFGKNYGGKTILVDNGQYTTAIPADFKVKNLEQVAEILKNSSTKVM